MEIYIIISCQILYSFKDASEWAQWRSILVQLTSDNRIWILFQVNYWKTSEQHYWLLYIWDHSEPSCLVVSFQMELSPETYCRLVVTYNGALLQHTLSSYLLHLTVLTKVFFFPLTRRWGVGIFLGGPPAVLSRAQAFLPSSVTCSLSTYRTKH